MTLLKPAGMIIIVFAGFFLFCASSYALYNNAVTFGVIDTFSNPANLSRLGKNIASADHFQSISNNAIPAISFYSDFSGPYFKQGRSNMEGVRSYDMNFAFGSWGVVYSRIEEADSISTGDTIRLIQDFQDNSHTAGKQYVVGITGRQQQREHFKLFLSSKLPSEYLEGVRVGATIHAIKGLSYGNATLTGNVSVESSTKSNCDFNVNADYTGEDTIGSGYSMDLGATWQANDRLTFDVLLENVFGYINWQNIYNVTAKGNTENVIVDQNGNIINNPTISGTESVNNIKENLDFRSMWAATYRYSDNLLLTGIVEPYNNLTCHYYAGTKWAPFNTYNILAGYSSKYETVSLGIEFFTVKCILFANNESLSQARTLGILISGAIMD